MFTNISWHKGEISVPSPLNSNFELLCVPVQPKINTQTMDVQRIKINVDIIESVTNINLIKPSFNVIIPIIFSSPKFCTFLTTFQKFAWISCFKQ